jgi:hypothetical protein
MNTTQTITFTRGTENTVEVRFGTEETYTGTMTTEDRRTVLTLAEGELPGTTTRFEGADYRIAIRRLAKYVGVTPGTITTVRTDEKLVPATPVAPEPTVAPYKSALVVNGAVVSMAAARKWAKETLGQEYGAYVPRSVRRAYAAASAA